MSRLEAFLDQNQSLSDLNDVQKKAVSLPDDTHALIVAGAGSGKTRVLTHRTAYLIEHYHYQTSNIVSVTFTNKAAGEMRTRLESLIKRSLGGMWVGTFHSLCHRFLRQHAEACGLSDRFQIIDSEDQVRVCRQIIRELNIDEKSYTPRQAANFIASNKDHGLRATAINIDNQWQAIMVNIYSRYDEVCRRDSLVDFAEIILRTVEVWRDQPKLLGLYQARFEHLLIDEFQDTNATQYAWIQLLAGSKGRVFAVGDDDQSIYGWRGAKVANIRNFKHDFSQNMPVEVIRLEQNYRSTSNILTAANAIINKNTDRLGKRLWTDSGEGEPIGIYRAINGIDEAQFVIDTIEDWQYAKKSLEDIAVLYRTNAQSRVFEDMMLRHKIPYQIYGGLRFFERAEVKDVLAYVRLIVNSNDSAAFARIINLPTRGIGKRAVDGIAQQASLDNCSLWQTAVSLAPKNAKIQNFVSLIEQWQSQMPSLTLCELLEDIIENSGLLEHYAKEGKERLLTRKENLDELLVVASEYEASGYDDFLANTVLDMGENTELMEAEEKVQLMTLHSAKGLEFPMVFMVGLEDGILPSSRSVDDPEKLAEERRLAYVGMTRAQNKLHLSFASSRQLYGPRFMSNPPSRFLRDLPEETLDLIGFDY